MIETFATLTAAGDWLAEAMNSHLQGWLTTVDPDGTPQPTTVWFCRDGESVLIYSRPGKQKLRNIRANPRVSFHLNSDSLGEKWVVMTGTARVDTAIPPFTQVPAYHNKYQEALQQWGFDAKATEEAYSVPVRVEPSRIRLRIR